jgi:hypothetical protein
MAYREAAVRSTLSSILVMNLCLASSSALARPRCKFAYEEIKTTVIAPYLKDEIGRGYESYLSVAPIVTKKKKVVELTFIYVPPNTLDSPYLVILIDPCSKQIIRRYYADCCRLRR